MKRIGDMQAARPWRRDGERQRGAEMLQLACCLPVVFIVFMSCVQVALAGFSALNVAGASSVGLRSLDAEYLAGLDAASKNAYVKKMICNVGSQGLSDITVSETTVGYNNKDRSTYLDADLGFDSVASTSSDAYVSCKVTYKVPCVISFAPFRDMEMTRIVRESVRTDVTSGVR